MYYRIFIQDFSKIAVPVTRLMKKIVVFLWDPEQQVSFETLSQKICEAPMLTLPEGVDDIITYCDASILGFRAVLMHQVRVIAYSSRQLKLH